MKLYNYIISKLQFRKSLYFHGDYDTLMELLEAMENYRIKNENFEIEIESKTKFHLNLPPELVYQSEDSEETIDLKVDIVSKSGNLQELKFKGYMKTIIIIFSLAGLGLSLFSIIKGLYLTFLLIAILFSGVIYFINFYMNSKERMIYDEFKRSLFIRMKLHNKYLK